MIYSKEMTEFIIEALIDGNFIDEAYKEIALKVAEDEINYRLSLEKINNEKITVKKCPSLLETLNLATTKTEGIPEHYFECLVCMKCLMLEKLKLYIDDKIDLNDFMDWFTRATWLVENDSLISHFILRWAEYTSGHITKENFKDLIKKEIIKG